MWTLAGKRSAFNTLKVKLEDALLELLMLMGLERVHRERDMFLRVRLIGGYEGELYPWMHQCLSDVLRGFYHKILKWWSY